VPAIISNNMLVRYSRTVRALLSHNEARRHPTTNATGLGVRAIDGIRCRNSIESPSLALTITWLTLHSAISMSSRTLPKYFA
jgi:hypothetical protein